VDDSGIDSLEITRGGTRIRVAKTPPPAAATVTPAPSAAAAVTHEQAAPSAAAPAPASAPSAPPAPAPPAAAGTNWVDVKSPMVGTFYRSPSPEAPSYVEVGSHVNKGQTLCILEAMKLMNEMESEISGTIREICVENAEPVEYGQVLFRIEPDA
jgi:acetyl-CoA carboxylase biotin carboxyl carrier protein